MQAINITLDIASLEGKHLGDSNGTQKPSLKVHKKLTMSEKRSCIDTNIQVVAMKKI
jgi:hypothetical protein